MTTNCPYFPKDLVTHRLPDNYKNMQVLVKYVGLYFVLRVSPANAF